MSDAIFVALIAAATGLISAVITYVATSKRDRRSSFTEIARFRERWIQELRAELVEFHQLSLRKDHRNEDGFLYVEPASALMAKSMKIRLMLNPRDPDYETLMTSLHGKLQILTKEELSGIGGNATTAFIDASHRILGREWAKVKSEIHGNAKHK